MNTVIYIPPDTENKLRHIAQWFQQRYHFTPSLRQVATFVVSTMPEIDIQFTTTLARTARHQYLHTQAQPLRITKHDHDKLTEFAIRHKHLVGRDTGILFAALTNALLFSLNYNQRHERHR